MKIILIVLALLTSQVAAGALLSDNSYGHIYINMPASESKEKLENYNSDEEEYDKGWGCYYLYPKDNNGLPKFMVINEKIASIDVVTNQQNIKTRAGVGIGDTKANVLESYNNVRVTQHHYHKDGEYLEVSLENGNGIVFETKDNIIFRFHLGSYPAIRAVEGCY
jgi:hypothetical protein